VLGPGRESTRLSPGVNPLGGYPQRAMTSRRGIAESADARALLGLKERLDHETSFTLIEAGERNMDVGATRRDLERTTAAGNSVVLIADDGCELVGYVELVGGSCRRNRATPQLVLGVTRAASGQGVGSRLLQEAERWAATTATFRVTPAPLLKITTDHLDNADLNTPYSATLAAIGGVTPYTWAVTSGSLPAGLTLDSSTGEISGMSTASVVFKFTVTVTDPETPAMTASKAFTLPVLFQKSQRG
jgi:GNAT superfamily N-acetyltransferase